MGGHDDEVDLLVARGGDDFLRRPAKTHHIAGFDALIEVFLGQGLKLLARVGGHFLLIAVRVAQVRRERRRFRHVQQHQFGIEGPPQAGRVGQRAAGRIGKIQRYQDASQRDLLHDVSSGIGVMSQESSGAVLRTGAAAASLCV